MDIRKIMVAWAWVIACLIWAQDSYSQGSQQIASRKIREITTTTFDNRKGQGETITLTEKFNRKGLITERIIANDKNEVTEHEMFEYGRKKRLIRQITLDSKTGQPVEIRQFSFDKWGNEILEELFGAQNKLKQRVVSTYDKSGKKIEEQVFDGSGILQKSTLNTYDDRGMLLTRTIRDGSGNVTYSKSNVYLY